MPDYQINATINPRGAQIGSRQVRQSLANIDQSASERGNSCARLSLAGLPLRE